MQKILPIVNCSCQENHTLLPYVQMVTSISCQYLEGFETTCSFWSFWCLLTNLQKKNIYQSKIPKRRRGHNLNSQNIYWVNFHGYPFSLCCPSKMCKMTKWVIWWRRMWQKKVGFKKLSMRENRLQGDSTRGCTKIKLHYFTIISKFWIN